MFKPKLFDVFKNFNVYLKKGILTKDIISGVIVAIIALPLSIALAIASGVSPEKGLITAIIAGFFISAFGGSDVQIGGPTGAFVIIVCGIIAKYSLEGLILATFMAGIFLILFGVLKLGNIIKYIPYTITVGFTAGIAVTLFSTQINDLFGLNLSNIPSEFIEKWGTYLKNFSQFHLPTFLIGLITILIIIIWPKINKKIPGSLVALIITTTLVALFQIPVETIGGRFGEIPKTLPFPKFSSVHLSTMANLIQPAFTIALLAAIESLLSAVVADGMTGKKHHSNTELIAQGIANIGSALFGGIPATGAIARTAANIKNGGRTPIAGIVHALTLLLIMMLFMPLAKLIPMATLAGILAVVSYNMLELKSIKMLFKSTKSDLFVMIITFLLTVIFDLVIAIELGMIIAMALIIKKLSENVSITSVDYYEEEEIESLSDLHQYTNQKIMIYDINGPLFFGAANTFLDILSEMDFETDIVIFDMEKVTVLDATAFDALRKIEAKCKSEHILPMFCNVCEQPLKLLNNYGRLDGIQGELIFDSLDIAYMEAEKIIKLKYEINKKRQNKRELVKK